MSKARRTPPLFDVLSGTGRRPGSSIGQRPIPVQVQVPSSATRPVSSPESRPSGTAVPSATYSRKRRAPMLWIGVSCLLALMAAVWYVAFHMGKTNTEQEMAARDSAPAPAPIGTNLTAPTNPLPPSNIELTATRPVSPAGNSTVQPPVVSQTEPKLVVASPGPRLIEDPRQAGVNYLHIVTLPVKDAEAAAAYLTSRGVKALAIPGRKVDPQGAKDNNPDHLVFALDGIPSDRFKASATEREALIDKVRQVGKRFQREEHGASDFAQPYWSKYDGK